MNAAIHACERAILGAYQDGIDEAAMQEARIEKATDEFFEILTAPRQFAGNIYEALTESAYGELEQEVCKAMVACYSAQSVGHQSMIDEAAAYMASAVYRLMMAQARRMAEEMRQP